MWAHSNYKILFTSFLLLSFAIGCGDPDKNANAGKPGDPLSPPTVMVVTPTDSSVIVCPNTPIVSATFSKAMNPATLKTSTFTLTGPGGTNVAGAVTYAATSNTATFTPSASLAASTKFTATITTGVADTFGNTLATNFVWTFTTSASCAVTVTLVTPPNGSVLACPNLPVVSATFNKAMNPATLNDTTFTLTGPGGAEVAGEVSYVAATNVATFTPSLGLMLSTPYTATITTGAADTFGDKLAANFVWTFTTSPSCANTPPTVTQVTPPNGNLLVCPDNAVVSATFSKAMNAATINPNTFILKPLVGANVVGLVSYVAATNVATFTPSAGLAPSTAYTATITTGVADTFGNKLAANYMWTFTTAASCTAVTPPALASSCAFGILAGSTVTNVPGTATKVTGDVGVWSGSAITGFDPPASITGAQHAGDAVAQTAQGDLTTAYNFAAAAAGGAVLTADIGGQTLAPGVYKTTSAQPSLGITGDLHLQGDSNAVWIFQIDSTLTTAAGQSQVILGGGAVPKNVFWQVGTSATLGTNTLFQGTIMANASITVTTGATLDGRALARIGGVTLDTNLVNVPPCQ